MPASPRRAARSSSCCRCRPATTATCSCPRVRCSTASARACRRWRCCRTCCATWRGRKTACARRWSRRCTRPTWPSTWRSRACRSATLTGRRRIRHAGRKAIRSRAWRRGRRRARRAICASMRCRRGWRRCADPRYSQPLRRLGADMRIANFRLSFCMLPALLLAAPAVAQTAPDTPDIPAEFVAPTDSFDYERREVMIPMRDGVGLHTVIIVPKGAKDAPILLTRTPYNADGRTSRMASPRMLDVLPEGDEVFVRSGYIRVVQDIRGKHGSEGDYVTARPLRGPLNHGDTDHATDAWDTIDWLVKHVPESNGRVGMIGSSYDGFTAAMALFDPHPALKVAAPYSPMVDGWIGDDWFSYGAFRQVMFSYFIGQMTARGRGAQIASTGYDDYATLLRAGSAAAYAKSIGLDQVPFWRKLTEHPAYDAFWQGQAVDKLLAKVPLKVPTMWLQGLWDQEDMYGANHAYAAMEGKDRGNDRNYLVMGPWRHSQVKGDGRSLGALQWNGDTALQFRRDVLKPFFDQYLVPGAPKADTPPVLVYDTGADRWGRLQAWPRSCAKGCAATS